MTSVGRHRTRHAGAWRAARCSPPGAPRTSAPPEGRRSPDRARPAARPWPTCVTRPRAPTPGSTAPVATRAPESPSQAISGGVATDPAATPRATRLSNTPNTRPSTTSSTRRTGSVKNGTSTTELASPMTATSTHATAGTSVLAITRDRRPPQRQRRDQPAAEVTGAGEERPGEAPDDPAHPEGGREGRDAGLAGVDEVEGDDDHQHVQRAAHVGLGEHARVHEPQLAVAGHDLDALDDLSEDVRPLRSVAARSRRSGCAARRSWRRRRARRRPRTRHRVRPRASSTPVITGPTSAADAPSSPVATVALASSDGRRAQRRQERRVGRSQDRVGDGGDDHERVHGDEVHVGDEEEPRRADGRAPARSTRRRSAAPGGSDRRRPRTPAPRGRRGASAPARSDRPRRPRRPGTR